MMKSRVIILITIDLLDHYMLNIRRDHTSYIMHALCFNCLLKCPLVNAMTGNISSTILSALRVYELFFPLSFVEGLCKDISVEYITPAWHAYTIQKTNKHWSIVTCTQFICISVVIFFLLQKSLFIFYLHCSFSMFTLYMYSVFFLKISLF